MKWIVSELFYPDEVSTALIMTEIAEKFAEKGPVGIICGPKGYEKSYQGQDKDLPSHIHIHRVNIPDFNKNGVVGRIFRLLLITIKMTFQIIVKVKKDDVVLMVTNPAFLLISITFIKRFKKFKLNVLVHDVFPENLIPANLVKKESLLYKIMKKIFDKAYKKADNLIVLGEDMGELLKEKLNVSDSVIRVVPNWFDPLIVPISQYSASKYFNLDLSNKIVIGFAGNIGRVQGLLEFIDSFVSANNSELALVLIGDGALKSRIQKDLDNRNITNIHLVGSKPRTEQVQFLNACDIGLITLKEGMKGLGVPSKTYNIMAAQKPVLYIGDRYSEVDRYIKKYANGWSFSWSNAEELVHFLKYLKIDDLVEINNKGQRSLDAVRKDFEKQRTLQLFEEI